MGFQNFFRRKEVGYPRFKSKKNHPPSYSTMCVNHNIRLEGKKLLLPKLKWLRIKAHRLDERTWCCPKCGMAHDRDYNASINIKNEGIRKPPLQNPSGFKWLGARHIMSTGVEHRQKIEKLGLLV